MTAAAMLAAACSGNGSGGSPTARASATFSSAVAYSQCVRSHGVPNFPDPDGTGQIPKPAAVRALREVSDALAQSATYACRSLNPTGQGPATVTIQDQQYYLRAAACMRSHGITNFPDPTFSGGSVETRVPSSIDTSSEQFTLAEQTCRRLIPPGLPGSGSSG